MHSVLFFTPVWLIFILFEWVNHLFDWFALHLSPQLNDTVYKTQSDSQHYSNFSSRTVHRSEGEEKSRIGSANRVNSEGMDSSQPTSGETQSDLDAIAILCANISISLQLQFLFFPLLQNKRVKKKKKAKYLRGKYFPIYLKSSEISLTDRCRQR